jgi:hypothetical protein
MSKTTKIILVVACIALCMVVGYTISKASPAGYHGQPNSNNSSGPADRVDVVYFHRTQRCSSCLYAENETLYTLETYFADELASGKLTFQSINVGDSQNAAIVEKYGAYASQLFINTIKDGTDHIEEVTDIWYAIHNDEAFIEIVKNKVEQSLTGEA